MWRRSARPRSDMLWAIRRIVPPVSLSRRPGRLGSSRQTQGPYQPPFANPGATSTFAGFSPLSPISITQHDIRQPYLMQWNLSVDQQLPGRIGLSVSYVGTRGLHLWGQGDVNPCIPTAIVNGIPNWADTQGPGGTPAACPSVHM